MKDKLKKFFASSVQYVDQHPTKSTIALFVLVGIIMLILGLVA